MQDSLKLVLANRVGQLLGPSTRLADLRIQGGHR
jgi:hypothetical protein